MYREVHRDARAAEMIQTLARDTQWRNQGLSRSQPRREKGRLQSSVITIYTCSLCIKVKIWVQLKGQGEPFLKNSQEQQTKVHLTPFNI